MRRKRQLEAEIIRLEDPSYIVATAPQADDRTRVLKHGESFGVFDRFGDILPSGPGHHGLYHQGTRHLSRFVLKMGKERPFLLGSAVTDNNLLLTVDLTNPDIYSDEKIIVPRGTMHFYRSRLLREGICYERLRVANYSQFPIEVFFCFELDADFADIFEVRGMKRERRGERLPDQVLNNTISLEYDGLDGVRRRTVIRCSPEPQSISRSIISYEKRLRPGTIASFLFVTTFDTSPRQVYLNFENAFKAAQGEARRKQSTACTVLTTNHRLNDWINRSFVDLQMMITETGLGPYPYAGVPWFSTVFGRDGIITAMEVLWMQPDVARGVLSYLAATQATEVVPEEDAEPGKILHETRKGEMAATKEIPFGRYYGSVDSTPLFIMLAGAYYQRTGDRDLIEKIWPNIQLALHWIDHYGDHDGDGFVEYYRKSPDGLIQQGWKDSHDSVFHADGSLVEGPVALCEVQGYVYSAKLRAAELALVLGHEDMAVELKQQAMKLRESFFRNFWSQKLKTYVLALDGEKKPCEVRTSNAGHTLFAEIADPHHARQLSKLFLSEDFFTGWGIRTVAAGEARYNPISYHNGSVWPHDNAMIAQGFAKYSNKTAVLQILRGLFDLSYFVENHRLPELFCGFARRPDEGPTNYPVACSPQSWSAGAVFLLIQSALGMTIDATKQEIHLHQPVLPDFLQDLRIMNLRVGKATIDLSFERHEFTVGVNVLRKKGNIRVVAIK